MLLNGQQDFLDVLKEEFKMIDWVTMKMSCDHDGIISNGEVVSLSKDGDSIEWSLVSFYLLLVHMMRLSLFVQSLNPL